MAPIRRPLLVAALAFGTVAGFGHGFATLGKRACHRRAHFEQHVADLCVGAARRADGADAAEAYGPPVDDAGETADEGRRGKHHGRHGHGGRFGADRGTFGGP